MDEIKTSFDQNIKSLQVSVKNKKKPTLIKLESITNKMMSSQDVMLKITKEAQA